MGNLMVMKTGEIANPSPVTVTPDLFAAQALALRNERKIGALMVVDDQGNPWVFYKSMIYCAQVSLNRFHAATA